MHTRVFQADTVARALATIAKELGPTALIVETRSTASGAEVVAALPGTQASPVRRAAARPGPQAPSAALGPLAERLSEAGIAPEVARTVLEALPGCDLFLDRPGDPAIPVVAARILAGLLAHRELPSEGRPTVALVGPTGVGKTTTLAKLASSAAVDEGLEVALITMDTYRMGAVEQLRAFADLLGAPLSVVFTPSDLRQALARHAAADRVFIDTPGRGPLDLRRVKEIRGYLEQGQVAPILVLPAGARLHDLRAAGRTFGVLRPQGLAITKWDETTAPGEALSYAIESGLPLTWITDGQEVPADLHSARPESVARSLLCGETARRNP